MQQLNRTWLIGILGAASAALTLLLYFALQPSRVHVVVAARDLEPFSPIRPQDLKVIAVEMATAAHLFPKAYQSTRDLEGLMTLRYLKAGEVLESSDPGLARQEQLARVVGANELPISYMIPQDHRAVPVSVRLPSASPGDFVEFYRPGSAEPVLKRPAQVVTNQGSSLLVLVRVEDVNRLLAAQNYTDLYAVLTAFPAREEDAAWSGSSF